jgi:hypothetical protein
MRIGLSVMVTMALAAVAGGSQSADRATVAHHLRARLLRLVRTQPGPPHTIIAGLRASAFVDNCVAAPPQIAAT